MKPQPIVIQMWDASNKDLMDSLTLRPLQALTWHDVASHGQKKPAIRGLRDNLEPVSTRRFRLGNHSHSIIKIYKNSLYINSLITRRFHNTMNNAMSRI